MLCSATPIAAPTAAPSATQLPGRMRSTNEPLVGSDQPFRADVAREPIRIRQTAHHDAVTRAGVYELAVAQIHADVRDAVGVGLKEDQVADARASHGRFAGVVL